MRLILDAMKIRGSKIKPSILLNYVSQHKQNSALSLEIARLLIDHGASVDPLVTGDESCFLEMVARVVSRTPNPEHLYPLLELLIERGCKVDPEWEHHGLMAGSPEITDWLLKRITYPKLTKKKAIHFVNQQTFDRIAPILPSSDNATPPLFERWLLEQQKERTASADTLQSIARWRLYRDTGEGIREIAVLNLSGDEAFPELHWGDILEVRFQNDMFPNKQWSSHVKEELQKRADAKAAAPAPAK